MGEADFNLSFCIVESPEGMAQKQQSQHGEGIFGSREFGVCTELVGGGPQAGFQFGGHRGSRVGRKLGLRELWMGKFVVCRVEHLCKIFCVFILKTKQSILNLLLIQLLPNLL
jgi:hypothetical protein